MRFLCASPRGDDASFPLNQPQLNINIQPDALNITSLSHHYSDPAAFSTHISSPSPCSNMHLVSCGLMPISAAETSNHSQCRQCRHVDHRTYCEHIYLTGRHRQKWLCVGMISQPCSPHLTGTDQLLSIWPLGGYTPSVLEGDITTAPNGLYLRSSEQAAIFLFLFKLRLEQIFFSIFRFKYYYSFINF